MANNPNAAKNLKPAKKGEVRNPNGRPKGAKSMKNRAIEMLSAMSSDKEYATPLCKALIDVLGNEDAKPSEIIKATEVLRDTIEGKPTQKIEQTNEDVTPPTKIELTAPDDDSKA
jgi:hypothetical protein